MVSVPHPACLPDAAMLAAMAMGFASARIVARVVSGREFSPSEGGSVAKIQVELGLRQLGRAVVAGWR